MDKQTVRLLAKGHALEADPMRPRERSKAHIKLAARNRAHDLSMRRHDGGARVDKPGIDPLSA